MQHVWERVDMQTGFQWRNLREGDHSEDRDVNEKILLKWIFEKWNGVMDWLDLA
jgi:hypothetical protein